MVKITKRARWHHARVGLKKLTDAQVLEVLELVAQGVPYAQIGVRFGVSKGTVADYVSGRRRRTRWDAFARWMMASR